VQIVNAGDSEFKAGEIVEQDKVEDLNEELKRRKVVYEPYCFYLSLGKKTSTSSRRPMFAR